jgi:formamidopyrimidine-DNA glycosylase
MMSIELPEAKILADQMNIELKGKCIKSYRLRDCEKLQKIGFINKDTKSFDQLVNRKVESVTSRGNAIRLKLDEEMNIILSPEYGGEIFYHSYEATVPEKFHLRIDFCDETALTVRFTSMGGMRVLKDAELMSSYVFKRDFNPAILSPVEEDFTFERFSKLLADNNRALKAVLVGKDAVLVGLSNSAFQDIIYRAKLHPKRKASELNLNEQKALYNSQACRSRETSVEREKPVLGLISESRSLHLNDGSEHEKKELPSLWVSYTGAEPWRRQSIRLPQMSSVKTTNVQSRWMPQTFQQRTRVLFLSFPPEQWNPNGCDYCRRQNHNDRYVDIEGCQLLENSSYVRIFYGICILQWQSGQYG